jgi:hypothetical protein
MDPKRMALPFINVLYTKNKNFVRGDLRYLIPEPLKMKNPGASG